MEFKIIKLPKERWEEYKKLRIFAVTVDTLAFWTTPEEDKKRTDEDWMKNLGDNSPQPMFFIESNGELVGMIRVAINSGEKVKHNAFIYSFFVKPEMRGMGAGKALLEQAISFLKEHNVKNVYLNVTVTQENAIRLYKKWGFKVIGKYKNILNYEGKYYDEDIMCLSL
ncbi:MAG: GNAT family N-acetyltransferase [Patescibacteria group bacterium]